MKIEFRTDSAAFYDEYEDYLTNQEMKNVEIARILYRIINDINIEDKDHGPIMDINGNKIGEWSL
jgi:hypothetical protein